MQLEHVRQPYAHRMHHMGWLVHAQLDAREARLLEDILDPDLLRLVSALLVGPPPF